MCDLHSRVKPDRPGRAVRLNISMDEGLVAAIDCIAPNRSAFLADAARAALLRRTVGPKRQGVERIGLVFIHQQDIPGG